ncbi:MAG: hypothetical protein JWM47_54, partial [Acidimicrobiales bacterium]|nr:hypothetical protein [Acidimicrobiales bacterium]
MTFLHPLRLLLLGGVAALAVA